MTKNTTWFWVAVVAVLLAAPNATIIRVAVDEADPIYWTFSRFVLISIVCLPFVIKGRNSLRSSVARKNVLIASVALTVGILSYVYAIYYSQASYVSILTLIKPIVFVILSAKLIGDTLTQRSIAGVILTAIGAMVLVVLPIAQNNSGVAFYPLATIFGLVYCVAYTLGFIYLRKANEAGVTMSMSIGVTSMMIAAVTYVLFLLFGDWSRTPVDGGYWLAVVYSALVVGLIARALNVISFERVGAAVIAALGYFEALVAILIPVAVLHEKLSVEMVIGGILILIGVYIVEYHKHPHAKYHFIHRNH